MERKNSVTVTRLYEVDMYEVRRNRFPFQTRVNDPLLRWISNRPPPDDRFALPV